MPEGPRDVQTAFTTLAKEGNAYHADTDDMITALLEDVSEAHQKKSRIASEQQKKFIERQEKMKLDNFQGQKIVSMLNSEIDKFNKRSTLGTISYKEAGEDFAIVPHVVYFLSQSKRITLSFFWVEPELNLKQGKVRFASYVTDTEGAGFNLLLCRKDETDLYGNWVVTHVKSSALARRKREIEPFGFDTSEGLHEIEKADHAMHVFEVEYSNDIKEAFFSLARSLIQRS